MSDRDGEKGVFLHGLKRSREAAFRAETFPYFRYVFQSGFGLAVSAILFAFVIFYTELLREVPASYPIGVIGAIAVALAAVRAPLRTYLRPADPVFLLAMETAVLRQYIQPALKRSIQAGVFRVLAVYLILVPIYVRAPATAAAASGRSLWLIGLIFAALGGWNAYGAWQERRTVYRSRRIALLLLRCVVTLACVAALLLGPMGPALVFSVLSVTIVTLCWKLPQQYALPWSKLIEEEQAVQRGWSRFLGWFVDVPSAESRPARRPWAAWLADRLSWSRQAAWRYLYAKTFSRGDTFGAFVRWVLLIAFLMLSASGHPAAVWPALGIGFFVGGIQLTEVRSQRWALSVYTLPIEPEARRPAAASVARVAGMSAALLLWAVASLSDGAPFSWIDAAMLAAGCVWHGWVIPRRIAKPRDEEDE
ncbi:ABC transporter permease [Cohnella pontilimi]|uniref:ABC transporter permease n=1 Tax=Cohnella pontilimi TaxID=2564100 RepID=UPI00145FB001|nr:ABC transporter permease [Cohnella pontilimi]